MERRSAGRGVMFWPLAVAGDLDCLDGDAGGVGGEGLQVGGISGEDRPARLGGGSDERVDRRSLVRPASQPGSPAGERDRNGLSDVACPQETVLRGIA